MSPEPRPSQINTTAAHHAGAMDQSLMNPLSSTSYYNSEQEFNDQLNIQATQSGYHSSATKQLRRNDGLTHAHSGSYSVADNPHYLTERSSTVENQSRFTPSTATFVSGDSSGTVSSATTPGSTTSSLVQSFPSSYQIGQHSQFFVPIPFSPRSVDDPIPSFSGWRADSTASHLEPPSSITREQYGYSSASSSLLPSHLTYASSSAAYQTSPSSGEMLTQTYTPTSSMFDSTDMPGGGNEKSHLFPFLETTHERTIQTATGEAVKPSIHAMATKGFFHAQNHWTCYRRNYFGLNAWYDLGYMAHNTQLFLEGRPIKAFAMHLSATIQGQESKVIELVQYTPKRDLGSKTPIATTKVAPSPPNVPLGGDSISPTGSYLTMSPFPLPGVLGYPYLPLQNEREPEDPEESSPASHIAPGSVRSRFSSTTGQGIGDGSKHSFDRVQFKGATQNNGKRRASQQFYVLIVELLVDVRSEDANAPEWKRVASCPSSELVVRGRSPSHYKDSDGRGTNNTGRGGSRGSYSKRGYHGSSSGGYGGPTSYSSGIGNPGAFRASHSHNNHNSLSPSSSYSGTSPSSDGDTVTDVKHPMEPSMSRDQLAHMQGFQSYRYFPETIYDGISVLPKVESPDNMSPPGVASLAVTQEDNKMALSDDYPAAVPGRHWINGSAVSSSSSTAAAGVSFHGYMGSETSRGWFPDLNGNGSSSSSVNY